METIIHIWGRRGKKKHSLVIEEFETNTPFKLSILLMLQEWGSDHLAVACELAFADEDD